MPGDAPHCRDSVPVLVSAKTGGRFQKGKSGNPRGRPRADFDLAVEARKHAALAISVLVEAAQDATAPTAARVSAANSLLDRGFGRAPQSLDINAKLDFGAQFEAFIRSLSPPGHDAKIIEVAAVDAKTDEKKSANVLDI